MKNLNDFISEEDKKKKGVRATKEGAGADDEKYVKMMEKYKRLRRTDQKKANELLEEIFTLGREGDVSKKAKIAGAYI